MDLIQFFGLLVPMTAFFGFLYREIKEETKSIREETKSIREESERIREEGRQQAARTDKLHEMFVDLLKDRKA